jgi:hypothetical protein
MLVIEKNEEDEAENGPEIASTDHLRARSAMRINTNLNKRPSLTID